MPSEIIEKPTSTPPNSANGLDNEIRAFEGSHVVQAPTTLPEPKVESKEAKVESKETLTGGEEKKVAPTLTDFNKILNTGNDSSLNKVQAKAAEASNEKGKVEQKKAEVDNSNDSNRGKELGIKTVEQESDEKDKRPERNFDGFSERETLYLKRMPYEAYEHFSKELREAKVSKEAHKKSVEAYEAKVKTLEAGKTVLPESYYDNPNSIYLAPEFQEMQGNVQMAKSVEQHWADQLNKVKQGEDWEDLENDPKTGNVVIGKTIKYKDTSDEVRILRYLNNASQQTSNLSNEVQRYVGQFQSKVQERTQRIGTVEKDMFPTFDNKESDEYKQTEAMKPVIQSWGILPDNPAFNLLCKAVATGVMLKNVLTSMTQQTETKKEVQQDQRKAGPTNNNFNGGGGGKVTAEPPSLDDFNKILNR